MIVDFHTHIFPPRVRENRRRYAEGDAAFAELYASPKAKMATAEELIASMDADGVDVSVVLSPGGSPALCREINDYILESAARYPKRLVAFTSFPTTSPAEAVAEIVRTANGGAAGIGEIRPENFTAAFRDPPAMRELAAAVAENGLILLLHASEPVGHSYSGKGTMTPGKLLPFIAGFPETTIVCAHWGGGLPFYGMMPEVAEALRNVYFDSAASPFLYGPDVYGIVAGLVGAGRVHFGSDHPLLGQKRALDDARAGNLNEDDLALVLGGNAARLLGLAEAD
jgi:predicted TIM-barrel fold metal-dependent hydrolase